MRKILWVVAAVLALAFALPSVAAQGKGQGKGAAKGKAETADVAAEKGKKEKDEKAKKEDEARERQAAQGRAFGKGHEKMIRDWFADKKNLQGLPPGLAKREKLPPGLQRQLERNGTLPPGLQKKVQPLPASLDSKLPKPPEGVKRIVVAGNVILLEERTAKILDIVKDVIGSGKSGGATTGVRRTD